MDTPDHYTADGIINYSTPATTAASLTNVAQQLIRQIPAEQLAALGEATIRIYLLYHAANTRYHRPQTASDLNAVARIFDAAGLNITTLNHRTKS